MVLVLLLREGGRKPKVPSHKRSSTQYWYLPLFITKGNGVLWLDLTLRTFAYVLMLFQFFSFSNLPYMIFKIKNAIAG